jgi:hypothetical protein
MKYVKTPVANKIVGSTLLLVDGRGMPASGWTNGAKIEAADILNAHDALVEALSEMTPGAAQWAFFALGFLVGVAVCLMVVRPWEEE